MSTLTSRDQRTMVGGLVVVLLLVSGSRGVPAVARWRDDAVVSSESLVRQADDAERSVQASTTTRDSLVARRVRLARLDSAVLEGESPALAAAALAEYVADVADDAKTQLGSVQTLADTAVRGPLTKVAIRASATGDLPSIARFLAGLESGPLLLAIRELGMTQQEIASVPNRPEALRAELTVEGIARIRHHAATRGRR
jgi:hypothetical protein